MMARVALPESKLKARRRSMRRRLALFSGALAVLICTSVVAVVRMPPVRVLAIQVQGAQTLSSTTIEAQVRELLQGSYLWFLPRNSIFLYPQEQIMHTLMTSHPTLESVQVHAVDFHTIAVGLSERQPRALWCSKEAAGCFFMDEQGVVYDIAPTFSEEVYTRYFGSTTGEGLPKQYLSEGDFQALSALVDAIDQKLHEEEVSVVMVDASNDVAIQFKTGFELKFALHDEAGDVFERLTLALTGEIFKAHVLKDFEYLDLRFGDKLYYKLK